MVGKRWDLPQEQNLMKLWIILQFLKIYILLFPLYQENALDFSKVSLTV